MAATDNKDATMLGRFGKDAGSLVGVEIAPDTIRIVQLQRRNRRCRVLARYKSRSNHRLAVIGQRSLARWRLP